MLHEDDEEIQRLVEMPGVFGGPHTGVLNNGHALLYSIMEKRKLTKPFCTMETLSGTQDVRVHTPADGKPSYKLAGIIAWEVAGFYPPSYELSLQDTYLGVDRHVSFYLLLKYHMKSIVPRSPSEVAFVQAIALIYESQRRKLLNGNNIPAHIRKKLMENSRLTWGNDLFAGWTRSSEDGHLSEYSSADFQELVDDLVEEMAARKLKANTAGSEDAVIAQ
ncbi:hypothetical protein V494_01949 [Pseudogymnoascus sp. VKM F-4513 (FW-928)]|nr:hypothetical protein V494_01949 [Pseudogymnoascus sp. VKM F-4513 (FW-928)]